MAKKAKRRPLRVTKTASTQSNDSDEMQQHNSATIIHPSPAMAISHKQRCGLARAKHTSQSPSTRPTSKPTLGDRFNALPSELRAEIFAFLLVRPVKWQLPHQHEPESCPRTISSWNVYPSIYNEANNTCIRCFNNNHYHGRVPLWRALQDPDPNVEKWNQKASGMGYRVWKNPWRSEWAPPVGNEFMCSDCWDLEFRPRPHPAQEEVLKTHLRCLCARRRDLGIFLVCRQWYEEAGSVFYARNTFAFESAAVFTGFVTCLPQRWRQKITRISIMAHHPGNPNGQEEEDSGWESSRKLSRVWPLLHKLPHLSYLELDAHFLSRPKIAHRLLKLSLQNVRRVCFVMHHPGRNNVSWGKWVWPKYHNARLVVGGFAEEVARAIKGQKPRRGLRRGLQNSVRQACEREAEKEEHVMHLDPEAYHQGMETGNIYQSTSSTAYSRLWWFEQKHHAGGNAAHFSRLNGLNGYISTELTHLHGVRAATVTTEPQGQAEQVEEEHWRHWPPTSLQSSDFGIRHLARWRDAMEFDFLAPIEPDEFLDESQKEVRGWDFLAPIEADEFRDESLRKERGWKFLRGFEVGIFA